MMHSAVEFLTSLGQALAGMSLYPPGHTARVAARTLVYENLLRVLPARGVLRFSFLYGDTVVGGEVLHALRAWDWSKKLSEVGIQRVELDAVPPPTDSDLEELLQALHLRLQVKDGSPMKSIAVRGLRAGSLSLGETDLRETVTDSSLDAESVLPSLTEETEAVRWIHDEAATGKAMPLVEVEGVVHGLAAAMHRNQHVIMPLLSLKTFDQYTTTHSCNVAMLSMGLAEQLGFAAADTRAVGTAALLHDIGKVHVPVEILVKAGRLTDHEMYLMQQHPVEGARMLSARGRGHALAAVVAYEHHVWTNGQGGYPTFRYPRRCHYASRVVHVCDVYDALCTRRPYREAWPRERTLALLQDRAGIEFDVEIVDAFVAMSLSTKESRTTLDERPQNDWNARVAAMATQLAGDAGAAEAKEQGGL